jgi:hypothetical protein
MVPPCLSRSPPRILNSEIQSILFKPTKDFRIHLLFSRLVPTIADHDARPLSGSLGERIRLHSQPACEG